MTNTEHVGEQVFVFPASSFFRHSSFELRHILKLPACATRLEGLGACSKFPRVAHP